MSAVRVVFVDRSTEIGNSSVADDKEERDSDKQV